MKRASNVINMIKEFEVAKTFTCLSLIILYILRKGKALIHVSSDDRVLPKMLVV